MNLSGSGASFKPGQSPPARGGPGVVGSRRRPSPPFPLEFVEVQHPDLPLELEGLSILHLTDLHIRRGRPAPADLRALGEHLSKLPVDIAVFTGDAMNHPGDETAALAAMERLCRSCRAKLGVFGVYGNHDSSGFRARAGLIPGIRWLRDECLDLPGHPLRLIAPEDPEDFLGTMLGATAPVGEQPRHEAAPRPFAIALTHYPTEIYPAAELGIPLVLAGHTHGGQLRLSPDIAPHTSTDLPGRLACGILRYRGTMCCVPRGLGEAVVGLRACCPRQAPIYVLTRGAFKDAECERLTRLIAW